MNNFRNEFSKWVGSYPWTYWATLTFKRERQTSASAFRAWDYWYKQQKLPRRSYYIIVCESGKRFGRLHLHSLIGIQGLQGEYSGAKYLEYSWKEKLGIAHIEPYNKELGASYYCSKYITKFLEDWQVGGIFP